MTPMDVRPDAVTVAIDSEEVVRLLNTPGRLEDAADLAEQVAQRARFVADELTPLVTPAPAA